MKKLFCAFAVMLGLCLTACEKPASDKGEGEVTFDNPTYASFSIAFEDGNAGAAFAPATKADPHGTTDAGSAEEYGISTVDVVFVATAATTVDVNNTPTPVAAGSVFLVKTFEAKDLDPQNPAPGANHAVEYKTPTFEVGEGTFDVYVIVNKPTNKAWNAGSAFDVKEIHTEATVDNPSIAQSKHFLMTNVLTGDDAADKANTQFKLEKRREDDPNEIAVAVERVVAKFTYDTGNTQGPVNVTLNEKGSNPKTAMEGVTAQLTGMQMFNMNSTAYYIMQFSADKAYVTDPNHSTPATKPLKNKLNELTSVAQPFNKPIYFLENTMASAEQKFGYATGMVFRAQYTVDAAKEEDVFTRVGLRGITTDTGNIDALKDGAIDTKFASYFEDAFAQASGYDGFEVFKTEFDGDAAVFKSDYTGNNATFYTYNDMMFVTPTEVAFYWYMNNDPAADPENGYMPESKLEEIGKLAEEIATASADEASAIAFGRTNNKGIGIYFSAQGYYTVAISNVGSGGTTNNFNREDGVMQPMEYCMVRNHWYQMVVKSLNGFGKPIPDIHPDVPVENVEASAEVTIKVMPWKLVREEVEL